jgi:hypothetical protein
VINVASESARKEDEERAVRAFNLKTQKLNHIKVYLCFLLLLCLILQPSLACFLEVVITNQPTTTHHHHCLGRTI